MLGTIERADPTRVLGAKLVELSLPVLLKRAVRGLGIACVDIHHIHLAGARRPILVCFLRTEYP